MSSWFSLALVTLLAVAPSIALPGGTAAAAPAPAVELVANPSLETGAQWPECFSPSGWGSEATWSLTAGRTGGRAVAVEIAGYVNGDRKLLQTETPQCAPTVTPGTSYTASVWYTSTAPVQMTLFRHTAEGWSYWGQLGGLDASATWTQATATTPAIPAGTDRVSFGISLAADGRLVTDDYSLTPVGVPAEPPTELVVNGSLAAGGATPTCFFTAGWGDRAAAGAIVADVPPGSAAGTRAMQYTVTGYASGDVKLLHSEAAGCAPSVVPGASYTASVAYRSTGTQQGLTAFQHTAAGWSYWTELAALPGSAEWTTATADLPPIPEGVDRISFGISLASNGVLATTAYSLKLVEPEEPEEPTGEPASIGSWEVMDAELPIRALHTTLLHDGRLLLIAGSGNDGAQFAAGTFRATVLDTETMTFTDIPVPYDMFCAGHVTLPDGKVLLAGGTESYPEEDQGPNTFKGSAKTYYFDPEDDQFHALSDMAGAHWYPTLTKLGTGDVWAAGGIDEKAEGTVITEMFDTSAMAWMPANQVPQTWSFWGTYPHMYLLDDGMMFYSGAHTFGNGLPGTGASLYDWTTASIWDVPGLRQKDMRDQAGSVLLPPAQDQRVMIVGGGNTDTANPAINLVDIIDLSGPNPTYVAGPDLPGTGKMYPNLVTLPDRTVLAADGGVFNRSTPVLTAAIYSPTDNAWLAIEPDPVGRVYHSTSTLLPDGRVIVLGSNPGDNSFESLISVYTPPYLHRGERPEVTAADDVLTYGESFDLTVSGDVVSASLISPMSPTHQTDTNTRLIDLPIAGVGDARVAQIPDNPNLVPPGPYMLTVLDSDDVPSTAIWVWVS